MGDQHVRLQARLIRRRCAAHRDDQQVQYPRVHQPRSGMKIGVKSGKPRDDHGGNALKFYASSVLISAASVPSSGRAHRRQPHPRSRWSRTSCAAVREVEFDIMYGEGISKEGDLVDLGSVAGVREIGRLVARRRRSARAARTQGVLRTIRDRRSIEAGVLSKHGVKRAGTKPRSRDSSPGEAPRRPHHPTRQAGQQRRAPAPRSL